MSMSGVFIGMGLGILINLGLMLWIHRAQENPPEMERFFSTKEQNDVPTCYVYCDYNPDKTKMFYEIPWALAELVQPPDSDLSFTECLAKLVVTKELG